MPLPMYSHKGKLRYSVVVLLFPKGCVAITACALVGSLKKDK